MRHSWLLFGVAAALLVGLAARSPDLWSRPAGFSLFPTLPDSGSPAPELMNESWLNTENERPLRLADLRGRVVLLNFWVFTCENCSHTLPALIEFDRAYRGGGLTIVGIHTPEFPPYSGEHDKGNVRRAVKAYGIQYPVAQDNDRRTWNAYGIQYWPSYVLIDRRGRIRYEGYGEFHEGDATYKEWSRRIEALLAEAQPTLRLQAEPEAGGLRLTLIAAPGARINARLRPSLELENGPVLRFDSPRVTPDSAYFADAPTAWAPPGTSLGRGVLRASVCPAGEKVCRTVTLEVDL